MRSCTSTKRRDNCLLLSCVDNNHIVKVLLIDGDGVALQRQGYFSEIFAKDYGVSLEKILPFFKNEYRQCQLGKADTNEALSPYLIEWGWQKSIDDFLEYWFRMSTVADEMVISKIQDMRSQGIACYLVSDQDKYRAEYTREKLEDDKKFDGYFFSCDIGYSKAQPEFFTAVLEKLPVKPDEIMYVDDEETDIAAAKQLGIQARLYRGLMDLEIS